MMAQGIQLPTRTARLSIALLIGGGTPWGVLTADDLAAPMVSVEPSTLAHSIRCVDLDGETFCTDIGFIDMSPTDTSAQALVLDAVASTEDGSRSGADSRYVHELMFELGSMNASALAQHQNEQIESARLSLEKVKAIRALAVQLEAAETEAGGTRPLLARKDLPLGGRSTTASVAAPAAVPYPATAEISAFKGKAVSKIKQEKYYYCGPATFQVIDWVDDGSRNAQTTWADRLGTEDNNETALSDITSLINTQTKWDNKAGAYAVISVHNQSEYFLKAALQYNIGLNQAPVVLHPRLLKSYFSYLKRDHQGHFQTGYGYTDTSVKFIEPYNEADFYSTNAANSAGYQSVSIKKMLDATKAAPSIALRTIGG